SAAGGEALSEESATTPAAGDEGAGGAGGANRAVGSLLKGFEHPLHLRLFGAPADNQALLGLNITPLQEGRYQVFVRIANFGIQPAARNLSLYLDGNLVDSVPVEIPAGSTIPQVWQLNADPEESSAV